MRFGRSWTAAAVVVLPVLASCVGDDPTSNGDDSSGSDGGSDATTISDSAPNDATSSTDSGVDAAPADPCKGEISGCPGLVNPSHLALWLRADTQVDCVGSHVTNWRDLSGNSRNVTAPTYPDGGAAKLPQCGVDKLNGHDVVTFTKPNEPTNPVLAETMTVDLGFMAGASFTVMMVIKPSFIDVGAPLGLISADRTNPGITGCTGNGAYNNGALDFIIAANTDGGSLTGTYDENAICPVFPQFTAKPPPAYVVVYVFDKTKGHTLQLAGNLSFIGDGGTLDLTPVVDLGLRPGSIGRESNANYDNRFRGDIAEIVVYDVALTTETTGINDYFDTRWGL